MKLLIHELVSYSQKHWAIIIYVLQMKQKTELLLI